MRIGVDYRLATQHIGGMGVYIRNLLKQLQTGDKDNDYILLNNSQRPDRMITVFDKILGVASEQLWVQLNLPQLVSEKKLSLLFCPNPPIPLFSPVPIVLTIPDLGFYYDAQLAWWVKAYLFITYFIAAQRAQLITTFSDHSKKDIKNILRVNESKIIITPLAAAEIFKPKSHFSYKDLPKKYGITKPYILSTPGSFIARKNVSCLLRAYAELSAPLRKKYQLVVGANTNSVYFQQVKLLTSQLGIEKDVVFLGYIPPESPELVDLYNGASIFAFPSLYEGFGLPPLEAMKCGIPVIVGNNSSLPEVVADAGILINNSTQLKQAITKLDANKKMSAQMREAGLKRGEDYSWKNTAKLFKQAVGSFAR